MAGGYSLRARLREATPMYNNDTDLSYNDIYGSEGVDGAVSQDELTAGADVTEDPAFAAGMPDAIPAGGSSVVEAIKLLIGGLTEEEKAEIAALCAPATTTVEDEIM